MGAALCFAGGVTNETEFLVATQDDHTQIDFLLNLHDRCPNYTTEKTPLKSQPGRNPQRNPRFPPGQGPQALTPPGLRDAAVKPGPLPQTRHPGGRGLADSARGAPREPHAACSASCARPCWLREAPAPTCPPGQPLPRPPLLVGTAGPAWCSQANYNSQDASRKRSAHVSAEPCVRRRGAPWDL